jgi:Mn2+/Fe2+ NRAMP family transporter
MRARTPLEETNDEALTPSEVVGPSKPRLWNILGPGLVTGASDDDPSGIATYSQAGAQYGYRLGWTLLLTYPLMVVIQAISARIGRTTGRGIAGNLRQHYSNALLQSIVWLLFIANTQLLVPALPIWLGVVAFGIICTAGQVFLKHTRYVAILKWLSLSLLAYFAVLCVERVQWGSLAESLFVPHFTADRDFWMLVVAILGTTISPYLFFWQAAQEVEDTKAEPWRQPLQRKPQQGPGALARIQLDTIVGMGFSNLVGLAIMVSAASTLHLHGVHKITTAAQAAEALRPIAGHFAFAMFALGILGTGLLSVPVLAGSAAYALGEARRWPVGLSRKPQAAKAFYGAITAATFLGALANLASFNAVTALLWAAIINAIVAVPVMCVLMFMSVNQRIMGKFVITPLWRILGWMATILMAAGAGMFLWTTLLSSRI